MSPGAESWALEFREVWYSYGRGPVLEDVTFRVAEQEFLGIIGPNGGGKTTLLKLALGLLRPDRGEIRVLGRSPEEARGDVGYVPQYAGFERSFPIDIMDVVLMGRLAGNRFRPREEDRRAARRALERMELDHLADSAVGEVSGGELQRALIARALAVEPRLLLLDEPTASVDSAVGEAVYRHLEELSREIAVVLVSHDVGVISRHVQSVGCLNRRLFHHGSEELTPEMIEEAYGAPVDLVAHGTSGRLLGEHDRPEERP